MCGQVSVMTSDVPEVLLDAPQRVGALLQLVHLILREGHVHHTVHAAAVQHTGERQEDLLADPVHPLDRPTGDGV